MCRRRGVCRVSSLRKYVSPARAASSDRAGGRHTREEQEEEEEEKGVVY